jgi:hypothetical protein
MNLKKCKQMRRFARNMTIGSPANSLIWIMGQLVNDKKSTRGVYRALKQQYREWRK